MLYKKWVQFCGERKTSALDPNVNFVLEFLTQLYNRCLGYSCLKTARSALSTILSIDGYCNIGEHPLRWLIPLVKFSKKILKRYPIFSL